MIGENAMSKEMKFFIYLIIHYAEHKGIGADEVINKLDKLELTNMVYDMYERYHQEAIENAYSDIDEQIKESSM